MKNNFIGELEKRLQTGEGASPEQAIEISKLQGNDLYTLFDLTNRIRDQFKKDEVHLCAILNAKSGFCSENCSFCPQSSHHQTQIETYPLLSSPKIFEAAVWASQSRATSFSIVTSGKRLEGKTELDTISKSFQEIKKQISIQRCASLGILSQESLQTLQNAGLQRYHHNLETSRSFFPKVCTTHDYEEDIETVKRAQKMGFQLCSGGIFGLGESWEQRIELAFTLKELEVDSIPINFLNPTKGTRMENVHYLTPVECLKIIALYRCILPEKDIFICGGREVNLRDLQAMMFTAGANGTMTGNYLTTQGRPPEEDIRMIQDIGLKVKPA